MTRMSRVWILALGAAAILTAASGFAAVIPEAGELSDKELRHPDLYIGNTYRPVAELPVDVYQRLSSDLSSLGVDPSNAYFDTRSGRWGTLIVTQPLIPGPGVGNNLQWSSFGLQEAPQGDTLERAAWTAFHGYLVDHAVELGIDPDELGEPRVTVLGERLIQIHVGREYDGIPVRDTFIKAAINSGNLVLTGTRNWANLSLDTRPAITVGAAEAALSDHVELAADGFRDEAHLEIVPMSGRKAAVADLAAGIDYRLAWVLTPEYGDLGSWEAMVDAQDGELIAFIDRNHYATADQRNLGGGARRVEGGVFPVSNDGEGDDGTLQFGFPMPFADIMVDGSPIGFTTTGGNVPAGGETGTITTELSGEFVRMNDTCGDVDESAAAGDLDLDGVALPGTDCEVPAGHSAGDTNASRSGFYELNRLKEQARGYLPSNTWLQQQLTANMNINLTCNAFWNGSTVNFYQSGGGCGNTGEIAAIFDHEWGHGMDDNDGNPVVSRPGEGIADIFAVNRLNDSCVGRGFRPAANCGGYGDPCLDCTGVREVDWEKHQSGAPHGADYAVACPPTGGNVGPCGRATHCEGHLVSETGWDLVHRDLTAAPYNFDLNTALELGTRLAYHGSSNTFNWYQCTFPNAASIDGCNADSGYLGYLTADDDNGDLTDGTPHMSAIFAAFDRHDIACPTPTVQDSGCAVGPAAAPANVVADTFSEGTELTWDSVTDAEEYWIFRTEGVHGCDFGKTLVGTTTDTTFTETGLRNGFEVSYSVTAVGANDACTSAMSTCVAVTPTEGPSGIITGTVTDSDTGDPIAGAAVEAVGPVTVGDETDASGQYNIVAPVGTYDVTADHADYDPVTETGIAVTDGGSVVVDFQLDLTPVPIAEINPAAFTLELPLGASSDEVLSIGNAGTLDLEWSVAEDSAPAPLSGGSVWSENFDGYTTGSQLHGQGGWKGWANDPVAGALASDVQAQSTPNAAEIVGASDLVREFDDLEIDSGKWVFTAWQFVPTGFTGQTYFILLNSYDDGGSNLNWSTQVNFNAATDQVVNDGTSGGTATLIRDQWVEIRVEIDLDANTQDFYYDGGLLYSGTWTEENSGGGEARLDTVDLYANTASAVYYDDFSLIDVTVPPVCTDPTDVPWLSVAPASGVTAPGNTDAVDLTVDTTGLALGDHSAHLCVTTNDPAAALVDVPVNLTVVDGSGPFIDVDPESLESTLPIGGSETEALTIANIGGGSLDWEVTEVTALTAAVRRLAGPTTSAPVGIGTPVQADGFSRAAGSGARQTVSHSFPSPLGDDEVTITHSTSMDIQTPNTVACSPDKGVTTSKNQFLRTFVLADFDITSDFDVTEVTFGIENLSGTADITINLYTLDGAFTYANLTEIGSTTTSLGPQTVSLVTVPVTGTAPAGSTLVVEIDAPDLSGVAAFFPGSNNLGETAPSYIASAACSIQEPTSYADIGFPQVQLVMTVTGTAGSLDCTLPTWLSADPTNGSLPSGESELVDVTLDATGLAEGTYEAGLCLASNAAAEPLVVVPVTLTVVDGAAVFEAASLEVDTSVTGISDGNGIFEPGELVEVVPGWLNSGTVAGSLNGAADAFSGPGGDLYDVTNNAASYGTVSPGTTATCEDGGECFEMSVDDPAVRPVTHWDATFDETLDDVAGTTKTWTLHIGDSFSDVPSASPFYPAIEGLLHSGVTGGCTDSEYCPGDSNTRSQMPVFMLRALEGVDYTPPACADGSEIFNDVPFSNGFCPWIEELADRGIVAGCGDGNYCPGAPVTRAQMAIFLLKTLEGDGYQPPTCTGVFDDVNCPSLFADWIEDLAARGITSGCTATEYCPGAAVTRGQMAVFVTSTFGLTLYGP